MAKKYVMLVNGIVGMGGGQMYANNKLAYMASLGWEPYVFSGMKGDIVIPTLQPYCRLIQEIMISPPLIYPRRVVRTVLDFIIREISPFDEAVIESGSGHMALWGELLAQKLQCKHMVHLLDERPDVVVPTEYLDFYRFKLARRELSGITSDSLKLLFRHNGEITDQNAYTLRSLCTNVVSDSGHDDAIRIPPAGITMGCIGRLEKDYIPAATDAFAAVAKAHPDQSFNVVFIGASDDKRHEERILSVLGALPNVTLILPGFVFPIPQQVLDQVDVFVSSAGSAGVSARNGRPTIALDSRDLKAIGVLGYTTSRSVYRVDEPPVDPAELLHAILFEHYLDGKTYTGPVASSDMSMLASHVEFLNASAQKKQYFDVSSMHAAGKDQKKKLVRLLLGSKGYVRFHDQGLAFLAKLKGKKHETE